MPHTLYFQNKITGSGVKTHRFLKKHREGGMLPLTSKFKIMPVNPIMTAEGIKKEHKKNIQKLVKMTL